MPQQKNSSLQNIGLSIFLISLAIGVISYFCLHNIALFDNFSRTLSIVMLAFGAIVTYLIGFLGEYNSITSFREFHSSDQSLLDLDQGYATIRDAFLFPYRITGKLVVSWGCFFAFLLMSLRFLADFSISAILASALALGSVLVMSLFFIFLFYRIFLQDLRLKALETISNSDHSFSSYGKKLTLRMKTTTCFVFIVGAAVVLTSVISYHRMTILLKQDQIAADIVTILDEGGDNERIRDFISKTKIGPSGNLLLVDRDGRLLSKNSNILLTEEIRSNLFGKYAFDVVRRKSVMAYDFVTVGKFLPHYYSTVFLVLPWSDYSDLLAKMRTSLLLLIILITIAAVIIARLTSDDLNRPISRLLFFVRSILAGELDKEVDILREDELGDFARNLERMRINLKSAIGNVNRITNDLNHETETVLAKARSITVTAQKQFFMMRQLTINLAELSSNEKHISQDVLKLTSAIEKTMTGTIGISRTLESLSTYADRLNGYVYDTSSSMLEMDTAMGEVAGVTNKFSELSNRIARTTDSIIENSDTIQHVITDTMNLSNLVTKSARLGDSKVEVTISGIKEIEKAMNETFASLTTLEEETTEIAGILGVISDVTEDTDLLALNATIIAAQAGRSGKGFAVVAEQVKNLAEKTESYTGEISRLIKTIIDGGEKVIQTTDVGIELVAETVTGSHQSSEYLSDILEAINDLNRIVHSLDKQSFSLFDQCNYFCTNMDNLSGQVTGIINTVNQQKKASKRLKQISEDIVNRSELTKNAADERLKLGASASSTIETFKDKMDNISIEMLEQSSNCNEVYRNTGELTESTEGNLSQTVIIAKDIGELKKLLDRMHEILSPYRIFFKQNGNSQFSPQGELDRTHEN
jgi:methyl-accepting chemotaxis protein